MKMNNIVGIITILLFVVSSSLFAQNVRGKYQVIHIRQLMTPLEFKTCGLEKLSPVELAQLDIWFQSYTIRMAETLTKINYPNTADVIESHIEGDFEGWEGETIFKLDNGQIWQQSSYAYTYHYAYRPEVLIYRTSGGYKMKVEDVDDTIYVKRLK